jgi:hypothetical protein
LNCLNPFRPSCHFYVPCYSPYTTNTTHTSMPPVGFKPTILVSERQNATRRRKDETCMPYS